MLGTRELVTFEGRWHKITDAGINPLPVQRPIPLWLGGSADRVVRRVARLGDGWMFAGGGRVPDGDAIASLEHAVGLSGRSSIVVASLARVYAHSARDDALVALMSELQASVDGKYVPSYEMAKVYFALGQDDTAYALLERAYEERSHSMVFLRVDPQLADRHFDPRFIELLRKVGLDRVSAGGGVSGPSTRSSSAGRRTSRS